MASSVATHSRLSLQSAGGVEDDEPGEFNGPPRPSSRFSIDSDGFPDSRRYALMVSGGDARRDKFKGATSRLRSLAAGTVGKAKKSVGIVRQKHWRSLSAESAQSLFSGVKRKAATPSPPLQDSPYYSTNRPFRPEPPVSALSLIEENGQHKTASQAYHHVASFGRHKSLPPQSLRSKVSYNLFPKPENNPRPGFRATLGPVVNSSEDGAPLPNDMSTPRSSTQSTIDSSPPATPPNGSAMPTPPLPRQHPARTASDDHRSFNFHGVPATRFSKIFDTNASVRPLFSQPPNGPAESDHSDVGSFVLPGNPRAANRASAGAVMAASDERPRLSIITMDWRISVAPQSVSSTLDSARADPHQFDSEHHYPEHNLEEQPGTRLASPDSTIAVIASSWRAYRRFAARKGADMQQSTRPNNIAAALSASAPASYSTTRLVPEPRRDLVPVSAMSAAPRDEFAQPREELAQEMLADTAFTDCPSALSGDSSFNFSNGLLAEAMIGVDLPFSHYVSAATYPSTGPPSELVGSVPTCAATGIESEETNTPYHQARRATTITATSFMFDLDDDTSSLNATPPTPFPLPDVPLAHSRDQSPGTATIYPTTSHSRHQSTTTASHTPAHSRDQSLTTAVQTPAHSRDQSMATISYSPAHSKNQSTATNSYSPAHSRNQSTATIPQTPNYSRDLSTTKFSRTPGHTRNRSTSTISQLLAHYRHQSTSSSTLYHSPDQQTTTTHSRGPSTASTLPPPPPPHHELLLNSPIDHALVFPSPPRFRTINKPLPPPPPRSAPLTVSSASVASSSPDSESVVSSLTAPPPPVEARLPHIVTERRSSAEAQQQQTWLDEDSCWGSPVDWGLDKGYLWEED